MAADDPNRAPPQATDDAPPSGHARGPLVASGLGLVLALVVLLVLAQWLAHNDPALLRRSLGPILTSLLFLLLGCSAIGVIKAFFPDFTVHGDVLFITLLVLPVVVYLLLAGQVSSFNVSGVLEANFLQSDLNQLLPPSASVSQELLTYLAPSSARTNLRDGTPTDTDACLARRTPTPTSGGSAVASGEPRLPTAATPPIATTAPYVNPVYRQPIGSSGSYGSYGSSGSGSSAGAGSNVDADQTTAGQPRAALATLAPTDVPVAGKSVYLPLEVGQRYDPVALSTQVARLAQSDSFKFVVFVINCKFLVADIPAAAAPEALRQQAGALLTANEDGPGALRDPVQFPAIGYDTIRASDSAQLALDLMSERNIDALIELDGSGNIVKVITRAQIESALLQELATRTAQ